MSALRWQVDPVLAFCAKTAELLQGVPPGWCRFASRVQSGGTYLGLKVVCLSTLRGISLSVMKPCAKRRSCPVDDNCSVSTPPPSIHFLLAMLRNKQAFWLDSFPASCRHDVRSVAEDCRPIVFSHGKRLNIGFPDYSSVGAREVGLFRTNIYRAEWPMQT